MTFKIVLINSDYHIGYEIIRNDLHQLLVSDYKIFSSFERIYPELIVNSFGIKNIKINPKKENVTVIHFVMVKVMEMVKVIVKK